MTWGVFFKTFRDGMAGRVPAAGPAPVHDVAGPAPVAGVAGTGRTRLVGMVLATSLALVTGFEGLRTVAYRDPVGIPTICIGETLGVKMGDVHSVEECKAILAASLPVYEKGMLKCSPTTATIPAKSFVAFLSFTYNVGVGGFCGSTLVKKLNAGDLRGACNELPKWDKAGNPLRPLPGLTRRRLEEQKLCLEGAAS